MVVRTIELLHVSAARELLILRNKWRKRSNKNQPSRIVADT